MKKIVFVSLILTTLCGLSFAEGKKPFECPMAKARKCMKMCPESLKGVETVSKNIEKGVEIIMTAKDSELIAKVQELAIVHYNNKETMEGSCPGRVEGAKITIANIETGVKVEITGDTPEIIKKIQEASMKEHKQAMEKKTAKPESKKAAKYVCPMKCAESDKPGKCPKCGMEMKKQK